MPSRSPNEQFIAGQWIAGEGDEFASRDPATSEVVWQGRAASASQVAAAVAAARAAFPAWAALDLSRRIGVAEAFANQLRQHKDSVADTLSRETGKPRWEALEEAGSMIAKVSLSVAAIHERRAPLDTEVAGVLARTRYRPHGVTAVLGPFNFPGHLPNGHIVPALLAGNTVVFKPSELAPRVAQQTLEMWQAAGIPRGVINLVQGGRDTGAALAAADIDGLFFTGSFAAGAALHRLFAGQPQKILALEMGGNNPLIAWDFLDVDAAAVITMQSAYITAGQRCSCARRLIVARAGPAAVGTAGGDALVTRLAALLPHMRVGPHTDTPEPFMGPVISPAAADRLMEAQADLLRRGGVAIVPMRRLPSPRGEGSASALLSPGLIDMTTVKDRPDVELFGPLLQIIRVDDFDAAVAEANATCYGLSASLLSDNRELFDRFASRSRAGVINFNRPTTGASGKLPFGGSGCSGNHRPSGYFAADYCSDPVASVVAEKLTMPSQRQPGLGV